MRRRAIGCVPAIMLAAGVAVWAGPVAAADPAAPPNDNIANAIDLGSLPAHPVADLGDATAQPDETCIDPNIDKSVWYRFTPATDMSVEFRFASPSNAFDFAIGLYSGTPAALHSVGCSTATSLGPRPGAAVPAQLVAGTNYYIQLGGTVDGRKTATLAATLRTNPYPVVAQGNLLRVRDSYTSGTATRSFAYGSAADTPVFGDWNGDGRSTVGRVKGNRWLLTDGTAGGPVNHDFAFGSASDVKIVGDWDGNGTVTPGVFRNGKFYLRNSNTTGNGDEVISFGRATDKPIVGDWDNVGRSEIGVFRDGLFLVPNPENEGEAAATRWRFGSKGDYPITGDWNLDGYDTAGVVRGNHWYLRNEYTSGVADTSFAYGSACNPALTQTQAATRLGCAG